MITVAIYIKDVDTLDYNRIDLFSDEKISVVSSIQNINDISKTFTDFSQTFVIPASKQNNKIFKHWYENSNDYPFNTLIKADAYIELDTILFRTGKIQLESATIKDNQPDSYSITFIGALGTLKDKFNGLFLKDLTDTTYDFVYGGATVRDKVVTTTASADVMFPLISSNRYWVYGGSGLNDINDIDTPIRYNELFPALRLKPILNMIETQFGINFDGTTSEPSTFLSDARFTNAYLWLKNAETFVPYFNYQLTPFQSSTGFPPNNTGVPAIYKFQSFDTTTMRFTAPNQNTTAYYNQIFFDYRGPAGSGEFQLELWNVTLNKSVYISPSLAPNNSTTATNTLLDSFLNNYQGTVFEIRMRTFFAPVTFNATYTKIRLVTTTASGVTNFTQTLFPTSNYTTNLSYFPLRKYMPEIKIEDFFSGLLKMFNLTCYSSDGINYTVEQLEDYYAAGTTRDITKYIKSDNTNLNRVKTYKKINFEYEKSESLVNVGFNSANGIEYGSLFYNTTNDGDEYNIKLPFEDLNFNNLKDKLQVGYALKTDLQKYIPKPVILYDYNPTDTTDLTSTNFYFSASTSGLGTSYTTYKAFGQEYFDGTNTYSLNFPAQQSTLTNLVIDNSLYNQYYSNYIGNVFNPKARLIKVSGILPTSLLTSLKLNDKILIRDKKYIINTMTTDLTTGEVQFELLTDFRVAIW